MLSDDELSEHFDKSQHEPRIYAEVQNTVELLSMRWLRGQGMEIGAGSYPTSLFGNASAILNDCDASLAFGGHELDLLCSVDAPEFGRLSEKKFDFVIASHVLEHVDSFLRAVENLICVVKPGGMIYIVLPDIEFLNDRLWLPMFDFDHHIDEYSEPFKYAKIHDNLYIEGSKDGIFQENNHAYLSDEYKQAIHTGKILENQRFLHHKHNYRFNGWLEIIESSRKFFNNKIVIEDARYGHERMDCHFMLKVNAHTKSC
jgi:SAM-dependent methyltransferase